MHDEKLLIETCIRGDRNAQKQLYDKFAGSLFAVALRYMKSRPDAEDVLQESFIKIYKNLGSFRFDSPFGIWLRRIVINTSLTALGRRKINYDIDDYPQEHLGASENLGLENLSFDYLLQMIGELPDGSKTIFNLYAIEGYKHAEIAEMLDISEGTSKSQYARARALLKEKIEHIRLQDIRK